MSMRVLFQISIDDLLSKNLTFSYRLNFRASIRESFARRREPSHLTNFFNALLENVSQSKTLEESIHVVSVLFSSSAFALPTSDTWLFPQGHLYFPPGRNSAHRLGEGLRRRQGGYCDVEMFCSKTKVILQIVSI